jgi:hypothetical protein
VAGTSEQPDSLFSQHAALTVVASVLVGAAVGCLTYWQAHSVPGSLLAAAIAFGGSLPVIARLIRR